MHPDDLILIGVGANLPSRFGAPLETCTAAVGALGGMGVLVPARSSWYRSSPVPPSDQPWFVNGVVAVTTALPPVALLERLHDLEQRFGRRRRIPGEARVLDVDLLAYGRRISDATPVLPHPRLHRRAFVLRPLAELAPEWRHPRLGATAAELLSGLAAGEMVEPIRPGPA
jgi:2-amino-4-hydroxy-6-hydroxymethyldihydropteridine diphosphokinase